MVATQTVVPDIVLDTRQRSFAFGKVYYFVMIEGPSCHCDTGEAVMWD